jgi:hypothetical protein
LVYLLFNNIATLSEAKKMHGLLGSDTMHYFQADTDISEGNDASIFWVQMHWIRISLGVQASYMDGGNGREKGVGERRRGEKETVCAHA